MVNKRKDVAKELEDSFKDLVLKYPFEKITIKMITDGAGLIRPTFYNHYADKYEMLEKICYNDIFKESEILVESNMVFEALVFAFSRIELHKEFYVQAAKVKGQNSFEYIIKNNLKNLFGKFFLQNKEKFNKHNEIFSYLNIAEYYANGLTFIIIKWIETGMYISSKELAEKYKVLVSTSIEYISSKI